MRKNKIQNIVLHIVPCNASTRPHEKINEFYVEVIKRRVNSYPLTVSQKITVIDLIIKNLKSRETLLNSD